MNYIPYFIVLMFPLVGFYKGERLKFLKPSYTFWVYLIFAAIRGNGNGDYFNYIQRVHLIDGFDKVLDGTGYPFEIGFRFIAYINNVLNLNPQFTIMCLNLISLSIIYYIIHKYSSNKWLSWIMYYPFLILFDMHHTRSAVAMSFVFLMFFNLIVERKSFYGILLALFGFSFHKSSILASVLIFIYYIYDSYITRKQEDKTLDDRNYYLILLIALLIRVVIQPMKLIENISQWFPQVRLLTKLAAYLSRDRWSYPFKLYDPRLLILLLIFTVGIYYLDRKKKTNRRYFEMILLTILVILLLSESTILTMRVYNYFNLFTIVYLPRLYDSFRDIPRLSIGQNRLVKESILILCLVYFVALIFIQVPYYVFW